MNGNAESPKPDIEPSLRNILLLDKSTDPLGAQVDEACDILGISLSPSGHEPKPVGQVHCRYGSREEWTLRWLLRKLEGAGCETQSICLEPKLWHLILELIPCFPVPNLARLLRAHGFVNILVKTLKTAVHALSNQGYGLPPSSNGASSESSSAADSSSATVEATVSLPKMSKKRKRDGRMVHQHRAITAYKGDVEPLYDAICATLAELQALTENDDYGYACEHLKMALRATPDKAAEILGSSLIITNHLLRKAAEVRDPIDVGAHRLSLSYWLEVWTTWYSRNAQTGAELPFSSNCLIPTLELLTTLDDVVDQICDKGDVTTILERLLLRHIILPARHSFESSKPRAARDDPSTEINVDGLLAPLRNIIVPGEPHDRPQHGKAHPIARLYSIILKYTPMATPIQRTSEKAWLQYIFDLITKQASILSSDSSECSPTQDLIRALKDMLQSLADRNVKLETSVLKKILEQHSHILDDENHHTDWDLVGLCLKIDPDVFVVPTTPKIPGNQDTRQPNKYLSALFERINAVTTWSDTIFQEAGSSIMEVVLLPLMNGFAHARDLVGFIGHWRSNLMQSQRLADDRGELPDSSEVGSVLRSQLNSKWNLWETDDLVQAVASQVELHLTVRQTEAILQHSKAALNATHADPEPIPSLTSAANLVIIDCILGGCKNEDAIEQLSAVVKGLYTLLLASCEAEPLPRYQSWRVWRCMATIKSRWTAELSLEPGIQIVEDKVARMGLNRLSNLGQGHSTDDLLQSLNYVLSVIESRGPLERHELARSTIQAVTAAFKSYNHQVQLEVHRCTNSPSSSEPAGRSLATHYRLQQYASQLCLRPTVLRLATPELQRTFLEQLFDYGLQSPIANTSASDKLVTEPMLWKEFLCSSTLEEDKALAKTFRSFEVDTFVKVQPNDDNPGKYTLIFDSIHRTPVHAFDRKQRAKVFNRVLENLLQITFLTPQLMKNHLKLLIGYLAHPNNLLNIVQHPSGFPEDLGDTNHQNTALIRIAETLNHTPGVDVEAVNLLKLLARRVLECQSTRDNEAQAASYLTIYFKSLHSALGSREFCSGVASAALVSVSLDFYRTNLQDFPGQLQHNPEEFPNFRQILLEILCKSIDGMGPYMRSRGGLESDVYCVGVFTSSFASYRDLLKQQPDLETIKAQLEQMADEFSRYVPVQKDSSLPSATGCNMKRALGAIRGTEGFLEATKAVNLLEAYQRSHDGPTVRGQRRQVSSVLNASQNLIAEEKAMLMTELVKQAAADSLDRRTLLLLQGLIISRTSVTSQDYENFPAALSQVVNYLCDRLLQPQAFDLSVLSLQTINMLLQKHPHTVTQYQVEQIMAVITTCASRSSSALKYTPKRTALQYLALCRVFSAVLSFHRKRLGGRYHLILPALQSLLRPLFIPYSSSSNPTNSSALTATHASHYSRLLLQLADPSLSSLIPHHPRRDQDHHNLNDATKTAKSIAGQYLHYLVMTYCNCQLKGRLEKEVREKLKPGLWAVLDVIPQEVMRVMNVAMGKEGRGVWKGLYGEWRRERGNGRDR